MKIKFILLAITICHVAGLSLAQRPTWPRLPANMTSELRHVEKDKIVGGEQTTIEEYPYQVALLHHGSLMCGGSLLSLNRVLTAAHCTDGQSASDLSVRVGSSFHASGGVVIQVAEIVQHPQYSSSDTDYDVSILKLAESIAVGDLGGTLDASTVLLPILEPETGEMCTVTGWGTLTEGGSIPSQLEYVDVPIVSRQDCRDAYGNSSITDRMICAGLKSAGGKDSCQGDSGGPLVEKGLHAGLPKVQVGIVSWGYGCARPDYPGVYTDVAYFRLWILENAGLL